MFVRLYQNVHGSVLAAFTRQPNRYPLTTVLAPATGELLQWVKGENAPLLSLLSHCVSSLERSKQELGIPTCHGT